jgi:hypothetical protein
LWQGAVLVVELKVVDMPAVQEVVQAAYYLLRR